MKGFKPGCGVGEGRLRAVPFTLKPGFGEGGTKKGLEFRFGGKNSALNKNLTEWPEAKRNQFHRHKQEAITVHPKPPINQ